MFDGTCGCAFQSNIIIIIQVPQEKSQLIIFRFDCHILKAVSRAVIHIA